jgi:hypothetical protein
MWRAVRLLGISSYDLQRLVGFVARIPLLERAAAATALLFALRRHGLLIGRRVSMTARAVAASGGAGCWRILSEGFGAIVREFLAWAA